MDAIAQSVARFGLKPPAVTLEVAIELIPMPSRAALVQFLGRNKALFPPRYRRGRGFDVRLLTIEEIEKIREMTIVDAEGSAAHSAAQNLARSLKMTRPPKQSFSSPIAAIAARAMLRNG